MVWFHLCPKTKPKWSYERHKQFLFQNVHTGSDHWDSESWNKKSPTIGAVELIRVKVPPLWASKALRVGRGIALPYLRPRHWRWGWGVSTMPRPLYPRERPDTHCTGGWVGPRAGLDGCGKISPPPGFDPRTVQPVASRYTDWAIAAPLFLLLLRCDWFFFPFN